MSKLLLLTKINLLQTFSLTKNNTSKLKSERRKKSLKTLGVILIIGYITFYVYMFAKSLMPTFVMIGKPIYLLAFLFTISSGYIFFMNLFRVKTYLFDFKDYDLLMSLPVSRNMVIASKIASQYVINLLCTFLIMIPGYIAYIRFCDLPNDALFFIALLIIPIIPLLASTIMGIILTWFTSLFHNKNVGSYVVYLFIVFIALFVSFKTGEMDEAEMVNQSVNMVDTFAKYYPLTTIFAGLLESFNIINMLIYFLLPIMLMGIFILIINVGYIPLRSRLLKQNIRSDYKVEDKKKKTPLMSLYKKELKKYFSNALYFINTAFGCIMLLIMIILLLLFNDYVVSQFESAISLDEMLTTKIYLIISLACVISVASNSSISLEGKSLWIMKSIPVSTDIIFLSKIMVTLTILIPTVLISGTFFGIYLHLSLTRFLFLYLMPLAYALFGSFNGLFLNLLFPKFEFDNEIRVIKQSLPVFLSMLMGVIVVFAPLSIFSINTSSIIIITLIVFMIDMALAIGIHYYGRRKFIKL